MKKTSKLSSSMEDYLEAIAVLKQKNKVARVRDISNLLNVETPSVTSALGKLSREGLVIHERYGYVDLTDKGQELAENVQKRHEILLKFLTGILNIDQATAAEDACKMEHAISPETFKRITKFMDFVDTCPLDDGPDWLKGFDHYFKTGHRPTCKIRQSKEKS